MIQIILVILSLILLVWFLTNRTTSRAKAGVKVGTIIFITIAILVILFPDTSNDAADFLGVGRGADLILYMLTIAFIGLVLSLYLKSREDQMRIAILARKVAILEANQKKPGKK